MGKSKNGMKLLVYAFLIFIAVLSLIPFLWSIDSSLKTVKYNYAHPLSWRPKPVAFGNYVKIFTMFSFGKNFTNSLIYAGGKTILTLIICPLAGYAFARKKFKGRNVIFILVLSLMMIPYQVLLIPTFLILKNFPLVGGNNILGVGGAGFLDTYWGLILPTAVTPFNIFLMRQYFLTLPKSIEEAARIDGASEFRIYWQIALPLALPALTAISIFSFQGAWNDFIWPLIVLRSRNLQPLTLGLQVFQDENFDLWPLLMAATLVTTAPMLGIFAIFQKYFFRGVSFIGTSK